MRIAGDPLTWRNIAKKMGSKEPPDKYAIIKYMMQEPLQFNPGMLHCG